MADNYLEKKMEEFKAMPSAGVASKNSQKQTITLSKLVAANKPYKSFNNKIIVREQHLKNLIEFASEHNRNIFTASESSDSNSAKLYYYPTINNTEVSTILDFLKQQNPNLLNFENQELLPKSFILIGTNEYNEYNSLNNNKFYFQLGAISNTITLRATEMGLNGTYTILSNPVNSQDYTLGNTQNNALGNLQDTLKLPFTPLVAIAIGKGSI